MVNEARENLNTVLALLSFIATIIGLYFTFSKSRPVREVVVRERVVSGTEEEKYSEIVSKKFSTKGSLSSFMYFFYYWFVQAVKFTFVYLFFSSSSEYDSTQTVTSFLFTLFIYIASMYFIYLIECKRLNALNRNHKLAKIHIFQTLSFLAFLPTLGIIGAIFKDDSYTTIQLVLLIGYLIANALASIGRLYQLTFSKPTVQSTQNRVKSLR